jgi:superfamily II DNA or RNA helicase
MSKIVIEKINDVVIKAHCDPDVAQELSDYFTFSVPGARFLPAVRRKVWDGKIRLFSSATRTIYAGLRLHIELFARERNYEVDFLDREHFLDQEFSLVDAKEYIKSLELTLEPRDYQIEAFAHAVRNRRCVLLSPTASGKSLIIYILSRYFYKKRTLIVVPTTSLVHQMASDFESYSGMDSNKFVHRILSGAEKDTELPFVISTWQSIYKMPKTWFSQFDTIIGDEAHLFKAKSLTSIMSKLIDCPNRFGFTGTLDGTHTHKLVLEGLFGPVKRVTSTADLMEQNHLAELKIKAIILQHSDSAKQIVKNADYHTEMDYIVCNPARNKFITNLALSLEGNTLLLFQYVEKHGKVLYDILKQSGREVYFVSGEVDGEIREDIRLAVEKSENSIIVASYGTFSTGVNIKNLHNVIFASPSKSRIRNLQSIGRGLRKSSTKNTATLYDIADDLTWKSKKNHTILHFAERIKIYNEEKFNYKIYNIGLKDS